MLKRGYQRCSYDPCVYFKKIRESIFIYLLIYVDDMLITSKDKSKIHKLKLILNEEFDMKDLGAGQQEEFWALIS